MYNFDGKNFSVKNYNRQKPFASFLPGIAGLRGIPMWVFYANKGQGICSFGISDKTRSIMEFCPALQAYQQVFNKGFRTFIKYKDADGEWDFFEPFCANDKNEEIEMTVSAESFSIKSENKKSGIVVEVQYFTLPNEDFAALVRRVKITNNRNAKDIEILDGIPEILACGAPTDDYKRMGNTLQAWSDVYNKENKIPFYRVRASVDDSSEVTKSDDGYFYLSSANGNLIAPIVDRKIIFGEDTSLHVPHLFCENSLEALLSKEQITANKFGCGFTPMSANLKNGQNVSINTLIGYTKDIDRINSDNRLFTPAFFDAKQQENTELVEQLVAEVGTQTAEPVFDKYIDSCFMDNLLRGGKPLVFDKTVYHVYSRKHGDMERDYNNYTVEPEFYSQGNGNFRDVNQNRRMDTWLFPETYDFNVKMFMDLINADGYNPLSIKGRKFTLENGCDVMKKHGISDETLSNLLKTKFTPGQIAEKTNNEAFLHDILAASSSETDAEYVEGYWSDHFTYNMDLIDSFLDVYPDKLEELLYGRNDYKFFDTGARVKPRSEKYTLTKNGIRQYDSVIPTKVEGEDSSKLECIKNDWARNEKGEIVYTNLYTKLLSLAANKFALLDPYGMGIEMDAVKPGWNDSLNGLSGLLGSGLSETIETKRIVDFLLNAPDQEIEVLQDVLDLTEKLKKEAENFKNDFTFWDEISTIRENYREKIYESLSDKTKKLCTCELKETLEIFSKKLGDGIEAALKTGNGIYPTYFYYTVTDYENKNGVITAKAMRQVLPPFFMEANARAMRTLNESKAKELYGKIKASDIYDKTLKMYKTSESLLTASYEMGRGTSFTPGWFENESVFTHMEYKYLLSLIDAGLYEEFYTDIKTALTPFLDPAIYGRNPLENSSFIASSSNPDPNTHGVGYIARLSGATVEMLSMWNIMFCGHKPFYMENGELVLELKPVLPSWLFDSEGKASFTLLGKTKVTYISKTGKNAWELSPGKIEVKCETCGGFIENGKIKGENAVCIRNGNASEIIVELV